jgi:GNAT superfamily N-acetyltransferase
MSAIAQQAEIQVSPVVSAADRDEFVRFPWRVYANDPVWVPPLLFERKEFIDPYRHPFYKHGTAALFLARRHGQPVGRILVSDDPNYNEQHHTNLGCFGMFECLDDTAAAHALFDAAAGWLRARGRTAVMGPIDYSTNYACGLLIDGFDTPPRVMMNHNPPYYIPLVESWGFRKAKDLYCWWFVTGNPTIREWCTRVERLAKRAGVTIRALKKSEVFEGVLRCKSIYHEAWKNNWGFVTMTDAEYHHLAEVLRFIAKPELLLMAEAQGKPVGFSMTLPDLYEAQAKINGRLTTLGLPIGLVKFLYHLRQVRTARLLTLGVLSEYRRRGIAELLIMRTAVYAYDVLGYTGAELSWTLEDNDMINRTIEAVGGQRYKTYRIYERELAGGQ